MVDTKLAICAGVLGPLPLSTSLMVINEMLALSRTVACFHSEYTFPFTAARYCYDIP